MSGETEREMERGEVNKRGRRTCVTAGCGDVGWGGSDEGPPKGYSQAQEGRGPMHQTMPVLREQKINKKWKTAGGSETDVETPR